MEIEFDEAKRRKILTERSLDLADAAAVFAEQHFQIEDLRKNYGETRFRVWGFLKGRRVSLVWTPRGNKRRIITLRHAHEHEHKIFQNSLD
jgi:uncharacterized DUF497 family protein